MYFKISIIIPCYNSENTIERAVNSILKQKWSGNILKDIEIILVDDCSTDNSKKIIDDFSKKYNNIISLSTEQNMGNPGTARNLGIQFSSSEYLMFLDSDDEFCPDMCETLYNVIIKEDVDIVSCNYYHFDEYRVYKRYHNDNGYNLISKDGMVIYDDFDSTFFGNILVWTKIFKKSLIIENNISFPNISEDFIFCTKTFIHSKKLIHLVDYYGVKHYIYEDSLSNSQSLDDIFNHFNVLYEVFNLIISNGYGIVDYKKLKFDDIKLSIIIIIKNATYLSDKKELLIVLNRLQEYESYFSFNDSLGSIILDFVNFFIIHGHIRISFLIIRFLHFLLNFNLIKSIYRLILNR